MSNFVNWRNYRSMRLRSGYMPEYVTVNPSLTVPGQSMTINEVEARYRRGQLLPGSPTPPVYTGDDFYIDLNKLDKVERADLARRNRANIGHIRDDMAKREAKRKQQLHEAEIQNKVDAALKAREEATKND